MWWAFRWPSEKVGFATDLVGNRRQMSAGTYWGYGLVAYGIAILQRPNLPGKPLTLRGKSDFRQISGTENL